MKVQHKSKPAEPWGREGEIGEVAWHKDGSSRVYRITPGGRNIPAQAYVNWGNYYTWERLGDLKIIL